MKRKGKLATLRSLRSFAALERFSCAFDEERITLLDGTQVHPDTYIKDKLRLYPNTWVLPKIDELIARETPKEKR